MFIPVRCEPHGEDGGTAVGLGGHGSCASEKVVRHRLVADGASGEVIDG
jgi:hypothetical protein